MTEIQALRTDPGSVLAASPDMLDPNFMHSVVLMCQHTDQGAFGLVLNRPLEVTLDHLLPEHPILATQPIPVFQGGPVGIDTLQFVHREPEAIPGGVELGEGLWLGGDVEALARFFASHGRDDHARVRMILGYAGWGAAQLEAELASGSWIPARMEPGEIFATRPDALWRRVLRTLGRDDVGLEDLPPDVSWN